MKNNFLYNRNHKKILQMDNKLIKIKNREDYKLYKDAIHNTPAV